MGNSVTSMIFCGASFAQEDDDDQPPMRAMDFAQMDSGSRAESENAFLSEFTNVLRDGLSVKKHDADGVKKRVLKLEADGTTLSWNVKGKSTSTDGTFSILNIKKITRGAFGKSTAKKKAKRCFTIATQDEKSFYVETKDSETRDILADGFELMLNRIAQPKGEAEEREPESTSEKK